MKRLTATILAVALALSGCATLSLPRNPTPVQRLDAIEQDYLTVLDAITLLRAAGHVADSDWSRIEDIDGVVSAAFQSVRADLAAGQPVDVSAFRRAVRAAVMELLPYLHAAEQARAAKVSPKTLTRGQ